MKQAKRNLRIRILGGMLAVWLLFWGYSSLWTISQTRDEQFRIVESVMDAATTGTATVFLSYLDEKPDDSAFPILPDNEARASITARLNNTKDISNLEIELSCYDQDDRLFAATGPTISLNYSIPSSSNPYYSQRHYGLLDIYRAFPADVADRLMEYLIYNEDWTMDDWVPGYLVGYGITFGSGFTDGQYVYPEAFVVYPLVVETPGELSYTSPTLDKSGDILECGTADIIWHYHSPLTEQQTRNMVQCEYLNFSPWFTLDETIPQAQAIVSDESKFLEYRKVAFKDRVDYIDNEFSASQLFATGLFQTEFYAIRTDTTLSSTDDFVGYYSDITDLHNSFTIVAAGTLYPLRDSLPTIVTTGLISLLLLSVVGLILCHTLGMVLDAQAEADQRRRNLTGAIAHDLKTPMAAVLGYAENLLEHTHPDKQDHYLRALHLQTRKMNDILAKMLEISKEDAPDNSLCLTEFSLGALCQEAAENCFTGEQAYLISGDATITADRELLLRCLDNFLSNAKRHIAPGGLVSITIRETTCEVFNPGSPIPPEALPHIWEPYFQADPSNSKTGSGLGLSIVREILTRHNFSYEAANQENGVAFRFDFRPKTQTNKGDNKMAKNKKRIALIFIGLILFLLLTALLLWEVYIPRPGIVLG